MQIVDLSQDIYEGMKVYPGHLKTVQFEHATHEETQPRFDSGFSFQTTGLILNDNGPTRFTFAGFPLKLCGAHGGPTRAVALIG
jgi:kynurenine formamidase